MINIDEYLSEKTYTIEEVIDKAYDNLDREKPRQYIGASGVGHQCNAYLSYCLRGFPETEVAPKVKRIFRDGHRIEEEVVEDLKLAGFEVSEVDEETGKQHRYSMFGNHVVGNGDGIIIIEEEKHILEIKSMNDARWKKCKKVGVKVSDYKYFAQMQLLMGLSGIHKACLVSYNKNSSEYLSEIVTYDEFEYADLLRRINVVLEGKGRKISSDPAYFACKMCFKRSTCWEGINPDPACHNCMHAKPVDTGDKAWHCTLHDSEAVKLCDEYTIYQPLKSGGSYE